MQGNQKRDTQSCVFVGIRRNSSEPVGLYMNETSKREPLAFDSERVQKVSQEFARAETKGNQKRETQLFVFVGIRRG